MTRSGKLTATVPGRILAWTVTLLVAPVIILLVFEAGLRLAGYGFDLRLFIPADESGRYLTANPEVARRYFRGADAPRFGNDDRIEAVKGDSTIRVIALGGSSTAGYPYFYNGSFPAMLSTRLKQAWPHHQIEVMNLGMTAISSYTVLDFMTEVLEQEPDLLVIYMGHNEFYGVLGSAATQRVGSSGLLTRTYVKLSRLRLVQLLRSLAGALPGSGLDDGARRGITRMARMVDRETIPLGGRLYRRTLANFETNLRKILRHARSDQVPLVVGTLVSNLGDQSPFVSLSTAGSDERSVVQLLDSSRTLLATGRAQASLLAARQALARDPGYALTWFRLGEAWRDLGQADSARICFEQARDRDGLRFRASSDINAIIRRVGREEKALVADVRASLAALSPDGIVGSNLMLEHLHPNLEGYFRMAAVFAEEIMRQPPLQQAGPPQPALEDAWYFRRLDITPIDLAIAGRQIEVLTSAWPFKPPGEGIRFSELIPTGLVDSLGLAALRGAANFWEIHAFLAEHYLKVSEYQGAIDEGRALVRAFPHEYRSHRILAHALISGERLTDALPVLNTMAELGEERYSAKWRGIILLTLTRDQEALPFLERAKELNPADAQVRYNLSGAYYRTKRLEPAIKELDSLLVLDSNYPGAREFRDQITLSQYK